TASPVRAGEALTVIVDGLTLRCSGALSDLAGLLESVTAKVSAAAATVAVGVPVIAPVWALSARPAGRVPEVSVQVMGGAAARGQHGAVGLAHLPVWQRAGGDRQRAGRRRAGVGAA